MGSTAQRGPTATDRCDHRRGTWNQVMERWWQQVRPCGIDRGRTHGCPPAGNTQDQYIDLIVPVTLTIPNGKGEVNAGATRWNYQSKQLKSSEPFQAVFEKGSATGSVLSWTNAATQ